MCPQLHLSTASSLASRQGCKCICSLLVLAATLNKTLPALAFHYIVYLVVLEIALVLLVYYAILIPFGSRLAALAPSQFICYVALLSLALDITSILCDMWRFICMLFINGITWCVNAWEVADILQSYLFLASCHLSWPQVWIQQFILCGYFLFGVSWVHSWFTLHQT